MEVAVKRTTLAIIALLVISCATAYQPRGLTGGFSETQVSATSYIVQFRGNGFSTSAGVAMLVLRRAAELTLENGFRYFRVTDSENRERHDFIKDNVERSSTVHFLTEAEPESMDAVYVIRDTAKAAGGTPLSEKAAETLRRFESEPAK